MTNDKSETNDESGAAGDNGSPENTKKNDLSVPLIPEAGGFKASSNEDDLKEGTKVSGISNLKEDTNEATTPTAEASAEAGHPVDPPRDVGPQHSHAQSIGEVVAVPGQHIIRVGLELFTQFVHSAFEFTCVVEVAQLDGLSEEVGVVFLGRLHKDTSADSVGVSTERVLDSVHLDPCVIQAQPHFRQGVVHGMQVIDIERHVYIVLASLGLSGTSF